VTTLYQVKDWDRHFENDRSRTRDRCSFVCIPNKRGVGMGYVLTEDDGSSILGCFLLLVEALSTQSRPRCGFLTDDGSPEGRPWSAHDLHVRFGIPEAAFARMLEVLSRPQVAWIVTTGSPWTHRQVTVNSPGMEGKGREGKGREDHRTTTSSSSTPPAAPPAVDPPDAPTRRIDTPTTPTEPDGQNQSLTAEIVTRWNSFAHQLKLPVVIKADERRRKGISARKREGMLDRLDEVFRKIKASAFLRGEAGRDGWKGASFDFVFCSPHNWLKILEGKYDDAKYTPQGRPKPPARKSMFRCPTCGHKENAAGMLNYSAYCGKCSVPMIRDRSLD